ncbi:enoyl-CoA hydratase [soil metagenome]
MTEAAGDYETILVETRGRVGLITLNRPKALNALNTALMTEVVAAATAFDEDPGIGAIVFTGSERAFAAGADITEMKDKSSEDASFGDLFAAWDRIPALRTPTIAAVAGYALGGGCELAMMCDLLIAADTAKFGQPEINLGVIPGIGGTQRLTRAIGKAKAMDLVLTARTIDATEAERWGLASRVLPAEGFVDAVVEIAANVASKSLPVAIAATDAVNRAFESSLADGLRFEKRTFRALFALDDQTEGMTAFVEKREPQFKNR